MQACAGALSTLLVYLLGRSAFGRRVRWWAALAAATYWVSIYFDGELLIPTLAIPLNLFALWTTLRLRTDERPRSALLCGAAWGLAAIARPHVLLLMPVLFFWLLALRWKERRGALLCGGALTLGTLLPILPLTAYNAAQGDAALIATQAGVNLWIGNNPVHARIGDVSTAVVPETRPGWWEGFHDAVAMAELAEGRELRPSEVSGHYSGRAWDWVFSNPGDAFSHWLLKLRLFWSAEELGNNQPVRGFAHRFGPLTRFLPLGFVVVAPLGLLGLLLVVLTRRESRVGLLPLWAFVVVYTLSVLAFFVNGRFRLPVMPVLFVLGAHAVFWIGARWRARAFAPLGAAGAVVAALVALAVTTPAKYRQGPSTTEFQLATIAWGEGELGAALAHADAALELRPDYVLAHTMRGNVLRRLGRLPEAEVAFRTALATNPVDREAWEALGELLLTDPTRSTEAVAIADGLVEAHPSYAQGHYLQGRARKAAGDPVGAERSFVTAAGLQPNDARFALGIGMERANQRRFRDAVEPYQRAFELLSVGGWSGASEEELEQTYWLTATQLVQVQVAAGDAPAARAFLQELERRHPGDPRVRALRARVSN